MTQQPSERVRPSSTVLVGRFGLLTTFLLVLPLAFAPRAEAGSPYGPAPSISADGRYVAFSSTADNLSAEDNDPAADIFVRDLQTGTATLVSRASGPTGAAGDRDSEAPAISVDGRFVAFASEADNLGAENNDPAANIFVRDLQANTTTLVSRASGAAGPAGDLRSEAPSISADGRFVAFDSIAHNLSDEDWSGIDVFVRDLQANTTTLVSRASGAAGAAGDGGSIDPSISADGRFVAFDSTAHNLSGEDWLGTDVFVRDLQANTTILVSRASGASGAPGDLGSIDPSISADGRYVAFDSLADNLSAEDNDAVFEDTFVRDLQANTTTLVSRASGASGAAADSGGRDQSRPSISADGRYVAFDSLADNLSTEDYDVLGTDCYYWHGWICYPARVGDVFVRDLQASTTTFASRASGAAGEPLHSTSLEPSISADGRYVAFSTCRRAEGSARVEISVRDLLSESTTWVGEEPAPGIGCGSLTVPTADTTPPKTKITKRAPNRTHKRKVKFKFKSSEPDSSFECKRDKKRLKPCGSPKKLKRLKKGKHKFKVRAIDAAGNTDPTPAKDKFKVLKPKRQR